MPESLRHNHGYYGLSGPAPQHLPSFLQHFRENGYRTAGIGKLHTPDEPRDWLIDHLDVYAECYESGSGNYRSPYFEYLEKRGLRDREDSIGLPELPGAQQHEGRPSLLPYEHSVEGWCVQQAKAFIAQNDERPWCMQVSLPRPHQCYTPDEQFWEMYPDDLALPPTIYQDAVQRPPHFRATANGFRGGQGQFEPRDFESWARRIWRGYLGCITQVDYALGELLEHLDESGLSDDTLVVYNSDHGAYSGTHGIPEKAPGICSEAVCRVPMLWRVPGVTTAGHQSTLLAENIDIAPTITSLCGLPPMKTADGRDLTPLLRGGSTPLREVAVMEHPWSKSLRWKNWRYVHYPAAMFGDEEAGELYDIEADPDETHNLYREPAQQDVLFECRSRLLDWLVCTTRLTTVWPPPQQDGGPAVYPVAADGKLPLESGAALNAERGYLGYT